MAAVQKMQPQPREWPCVAYVVEQRRHISEFGGWRGFLLRAWFVWGGRFIYFILRLPVPDVNGFWKEAQSVCIDDDTEEARRRAEGMLKDESWYFQEYPVNRCLPDATCQFGVQVFKDNLLYEKRELDLVAVERSQLAELERQGDTLIKSLRART